MGLASRYEAVGCVGGVRIDLRQRSCLDGGEWGWVSVGT